MKLSSGKTAESQSVELPQPTTGGQRLKQLVAIRHAQFRTAAVVVFVVLLLLTLHLQLCRILPESTIHCVE